VPSSADSSDKETNSAGVIESLIVQPGLRGRGTHA
jgi:hypothetical protein